MLYVFHSFVSCAGCFHTDITLYHSLSIRLLAIHCSWYIWVWKDVSFGKGVHYVHWKLEWSWHWKVIVLSDNERINVIDTCTVENSSCSFLMTRVFYTVDHSTVIRTQIMTEATPMKKKKHEKGKVHSRSPLLGACNWHIFLQRRFHK